MCWEIHCTQPFAGTPLECKSKTRLRKRTLDELSSNLRCVDLFDRTCALRAFSAVDETHNCAYDQSNYIHIKGGRGDRGGSFFLGVGLADPNQSIAIQVEEYLQCKNTEAESPVDFDGNS